MKQAKVGPVVGEPFCSLTASSLNIGSIHPVLAERAAWDFMEKNKDKTNFDLVTLEPVLVRDSSCASLPLDAHHSDLMYFGRAARCMASVPSPPDSFSLLSLTRFFLIGIANRARGTVRSSFLLRYISCSSLSIVSLFFSQPPKDVNSLNITSYQIHSKFTSPPDPNPEIFALNIVDVRDVALAHVLALERPEAGGERFAVSAGPFYWDELSLFISYFLFLVVSKFAQSFHFFLLCIDRRRCSQRWCQRRNSWHSGSRLRTKNNC